MEERADPPQVINIEIKRNDQKEVVIDLPWLNCIDWKPSLNQLCVICDDKEDIYIARLSQDERSYKPRKWVWRDENDRTKKYEDIYWWFPIPDEPTKED